MSDFEKFSAEFEMALRGKKPDNLEGVDFSLSYPESSNKRMLKNAAVLLTMPSMVAKGLPWMEWYVDGPLHDNEATTFSESYRDAISLPTYSLSVVAQKAGRTVLADRFLDRTRADASDILLSLGAAPPRKVRDHGKIGGPILLIGDGSFDPVKGSKNLPMIPGVGMRCHVREEVPGGGHTGPFQYLSTHDHSVVVAQILSLPYRAKSYRWTHECFNLILRLWTGARRWGFKGEEVEIVRAYFQDPTNPTFARQIHLWAAEFPSNQPRLRVRGTDNSIESHALFLADSSTGGRAFCGQYADGKVVYASCDDGRRGPTYIKPQKTEIIGNRVRCFYVDESREIYVDRIVRNEAWASLIMPETSACVFRPTIEDPPSPPPATTKPPKKESKWNFL